jgi:hypothetical protein
LYTAQVREPAALARDRFIKVDIPDEVSRQSVEEAQLPTDWSRRITVPYPLDSRLTARNPKG